MVAIKTLIFTILVPGTVTVYIPYLLLTSANTAQRLPLGAFRYFGVVLILIGAAFYFRCAWDFTFTGRGTPAPIDPPKKLVARGLYRFVRNPMYVGVVTLLLGEAILFGSRALFVYAAAAFVIFNLFVVFYEEPVLRRKFGESYLNYCATVPRWFPRLKH
jgi:protein-S-isoprenylcysteine O-methyltransferase Ste14